MNGLDSPLEALAFIPVNFGPLLSAAVNNLWAWLAVITAALSFWKLRTTPKTTSSCISIPPPPPPTTATTKTTPLKEKAMIKEQAEKEGEEEGVLTRGNSKKFFTVYYEERENDQMIMENQEDDDHEMMDGGDEVEDDKSCGRRVMMMKRWRSSPELRVEMRGGDLIGWYSYQNRKVIDGSVVRLWEEERESCCSSPSPRSCRSRRCVGVTAAWS